MISGTLGGRDAMRASYVAGWNECAEENQWDDDE